MSKPLGFSDFYLTGLCLCILYDPVILQQIKKAKMFRKKQGNKVLEGGNKYFIKELIL